MAARSGRSWKGKGYGKGKESHEKGKGGGKGGQKPTDDPNFVRWSEGMRLQGSPSGASYRVEAYVASGSFSRVFRVKREAPATEASKRRWGTASTEDGHVLAAKVMRKEDAYIQYTSSGPKEGELLQRLEAAQRESGEVLTMRCLDSFATKDDAGEDYWCLILEWLDASLFDVVRANGNRGLHLATVRTVLRQLLEQLQVLQSLSCTHTDIKHKNCCLVNTEHFLVPSDRGKDMILTRPVAKFIDYGNAVFEGDHKPHPIHTKQFRCPEVLLNVREGWGPSSDTWTVGVTAAFLVSGQLIFNSHEPQELVRRMVEALGPFPQRLLDDAKDRRLCRVAEEAAKSEDLAEWLGLAQAEKGSAESACLDLLREMLRPDPKDRITAAAALQHPFLREGGPGSQAVLPAKPASAALRTLEGH